MKKFIVFILAFLYLGVSSGIAMDIHYCMGEKAGIEFFGEHKNDRCSKCGMKEKKGGCCSNEQQFHKLNDAHKSVSNDISFGCEPTFLQNPSATIEHPHFSSICQRANGYHALPPELTGVGRCILFCIFRL